MTASYYLTHLHLRDVASEAFAAYWVPQIAKKYRIAAARDRLLQAIAALDAGEGPEEARAALVDLIASALAEHSDLCAATARAPAEAVLAAILDNCMPMPDGQS